MRPILSYYGGKQRLAARIIDWLPRHTVYVEVFCGGAAVFFAKDRRPFHPRLPYCEVLNDRDERIIAVYRVAQDPRLRQELLHRLLHTPYSRVEHRRSRDVWRTWHAHDAVTQAWATLVLAQQSFSHDLSGGWSTGVFGQNHSTTYALWREVLPTLMDRLHEVYLECDDALAVIQRWDSPQTVFYVDPPYVGANQRWYGGYTEGDLQSLIDVLDTCQGSFVLSGYASPLIPDHWEHQTVDTFCSASGQGITQGHDRSRPATAVDLGPRRRTEHLWRVDRSARMRPDLLDLFACMETLPLFTDALADRAD